MVVLATLTALVHDEIAAAGPPSYHGRDVHRREARGALIGRVGRDDGAAGAAWDERCRQSDRVWHGRWWAPFQMSMNYSLNSLLVLGLRPCLLEKNTETGRYDFEVRFHGGSLNCTKKSPL